MRSYLKYLNIVYITMSMTKAKAIWFNIVSVLVVCNLTRISRGDLLNKLSDTLEYMGLYKEHGDSGVYPEAIMGTAEIIRYYGYSVETHEVITEDGYILIIHRIPGNKYNATRNNRPPVFLQHGLTCTSACWLLNGVKDSLGFMLADESYDTWLGNLRGNIYCRRHISMSTEDSRFYDYNIDDHALLDIPAVIDYILKITDSEHLTYVGHSLGSTIGVFLLAGKPIYNKKINHAVFLAPVVYSKYAKNPLRIIGTNIKQITEWYRLLGTNAIPPSTDMLRGFFKSLCSHYPGVIICEAYIKSLNGYNDQLFDPKRAHVLAANIQGGTAINIIIHFAQIHYSPNPARFDYGPQRNLQKYGQVQPPAYNFSKISTKSSIFYGYMDLFTDVKDIETLAKQLRNVQLVEEVAYDTWCHTDFFWAIDLREHFYERLLQVLKQFQ